MYAVANGITPEQQGGIAAMLYLQMLRRGITTVGEFHYVHHQGDGGSGCDKTYYTIDGTTPTTQSRVYSSTSPISISSTTALNV